MPRPRWLWRPLAIVFILSALWPALDRETGRAEARLVSREVLALYDSSQAPGPSQLLPTRTNLIHELAEMPLNFLGLRLRYLDVNSERLPDEEEMLRYHGVVTWFQDNRLKGAQSYLLWLRRQITAARRMVVLGTLGAGVDSDTDAAVPEEQVQAAYAAMGLRHSGMHTDNPLLLSVRTQTPGMIGFERSLSGEADYYERIHSLASTNRVYLTINRSDLLDGDSDVVVTGPWGGFALAHYIYYEQPRTFQKRWLINPFAFFEEAFGVKGYPRPDVSTLNGSRVFYTHVDGDGFNNVSEVDFKSLSAEVILRKFIRRYDLPFTVSIVVNDIDPAGAGGSRQLQVARDIFAEPNVEPASHTHTHPFDWSKPINLQREITASVEFLNQHVAAPERPVKLLLWSGATNPREPAVERADKAGLLNINGGDGRFDPAFDSYAHLAPLTTQVGRAVQFYTSNANDNIYGNDWTGPYYGLRNVIATWEKTESPRRIGALNVYYHIFTGEKVASTRALREVYDYALQHDIAPVFTADYVKTVQGFLTTQLARENSDTWRVRHYGALRTLRFDDEQRFPDFSRSRNVIGFWHYQGSLYIFLGEEPEALIAFSPTPSAQPYILRASHRILDWKLERDRISLAVDGIGNKKVTVGNLPRDAEFEVTQAAAGGERRMRMRSDQAGTLTWSSSARGRLGITIAPAGPSASAAILGLLRPTGA